MTPPRPETLDPTAEWDWSIGKKDICNVAELPEGVAWLEELQASPDGESVGCVAFLEDGAGYGLVRNGELLEQTFERAWLARYSPDSRLTTIVQQDGVWTMAVDGEPWEETFDYAWGTRFNQNGDIAISVQREGGYGMAVNGEVWDPLFENANNFALSCSSADTVAVVQTVTLGQADVFTYQKGCYTVARNGQAWDRNFVNCWSPILDPKGQRVAASMRTTLYDYSIVVDGEPWSKNFPCVWEPCFHPTSGAVIAPVRIKGKWGLASNGEIIWPTTLFQCWKQTFSADGSKLYAIVSPSFGRWTVACDGAPWNVGFGGMIDDLVISPDGKRAAAVGKEGEQWAVVVDNCIWTGWYEMAWKPVFSPDSKHVAVKLERSGKRYTVAIDGHVHEHDFDQLWDPIFSSDSSKMLLRVVENGVFKRIVLPVHAAGH